MKRILYASWAVSVVLPVLAVIVTWVVVHTSLQQRHRLELTKVTEAAKITSQAYWHAWHNSALSEEANSFCTIRALILLYEQRQLLDEAKQLVEKEPNDLYAGQLLHSIGVDTAEDYFLWAKNKIDSEASKFQELEVDGYIFPGIEVHNSDGFKQFITGAILCPSNERLVLIGD